jgi:hypothetical protein
MEGKPEDFSSFQQSYPSEEENFSPLASTDAVTFSSFHDHSQEQQ